MRFGRALAGLLLVSSLAVAVAPSALPATGLPLPRTMASLPLSTVRDAVVDPVHDLLFVTGGGEGRVVVVDLVSGQVTRLPHLAGADQLDLDDTSEHVWVSMLGETTVGRVSTSPPFAVQTMPVGRRCVHDLVATAGSVFLAAEPARSGCYGQWQDVVALDPTSGETTPPLLFSRLYSPELRQIPGTTRFHWQESGITHSPSGIIDGATRTVVATQRDSYALDITPGGEEVLTAFGKLLSTHDLSEQGAVSLPGDLSVTSGSLGPTGLVAGTRSGTISVAELLTGTELGTWHTDAEEELTAHRTLWHGSTLLALAGTSPVRLLAVEDVRTPPESTLTVQDPDRERFYRLGERTDLAGTLTDAEGTPLVGADIDVRTKDGVLLGRTVTGSGGGWQVEVVLLDRSLRVHHTSGDRIVSTAFLNWYGAPAHPVLRVQGPEPTSVDEPLVYTGDVVDDNGVPVPGVDVNIEWQCGGGGRAVVMTDDNGLFQFRTRPPRCPELDLSFALDGRWGYYGTPGYQELTTRLPWRVSTLTATGPSSVANRQSLTWKVQVLVDGAPAVGRVVRYEGSDERGTIVTDARGEAALTVRAPSASFPVTDFSYDGGADTLGSFLRARTTVTTDVDSLEISHDPANPSAGERLRFSGRVILGDGGSPAGDLVRTTIDGGRPGPTATVRSDGTFEVALWPTAGEHFWVFTHQGGATARVDLVVPEQPMELRTGTSNTVGDRPLVVTQTMPRRAGLCVRHVWERASAGGWRTVDRSGCRQTGSLGRARFRMPDGLGEGRYRVRAGSRGDDIVAAARGAWSYFRLS